MPSKKKSTNKTFILTFDLEEWFHILDIESLEDKSKWDHFEVRIYKNTERILNLLQENNLITTFFVLGWAAIKYPDLVRNISDQGHEIGSHSLDHILVYKSDPKAFREDLRTSISILQDITQTRVRAYRAPGFSITKETPWAFEILAEEGIEIDSSIFPASRGHGGVKGFHIDRPFRIEINGMIIKEFPINVFKLGGFNIPFSGGGYFRNLPFQAILSFSDRSEYILTYFHPRDFDPGQPVLSDLSLIRKLKSYRGLKKSVKRFDHYLKRYKFMDISSAEKTIEWETTPLFEPSEDWK
jgi:polysaccharide deacetylase family protein (PEP-CTERM system associated)